MSQKLLILCDDPCCAPGTPYKLQTNIFGTNQLNSNQASLLYLKVYKVTVIKQIKFLYLIAIYGKYCNSKKVLCNDMKNLLLSVCMSSLLACFMKKEEFPKLCKLKEYRQWMM